MYTKGYFCPFCKNEFYVLPESCYECKRKIPGELVSKMAFVISLQKNIEKSKLEGIIDDDFLHIFVNACSDKERSLNSQLQELVEQDKIKSAAEVEAKLIKDEKDFVPAEDTSEKTTSYPPLEEFIHADKKEIAEDVKLVAEDSASDIKPVEDISLVKLDHSLIHTNEKDISANVKTVAEDTKPVEDVLLLKKDIPANVKTVAEDTKLVEDVLLLKKDIPANVKTVAEDTKLVEDVPLLKFDPREKPTTKQQEIASPAEVIAAKAAKPVKTKNKIKKPAQQIPVPKKTVGFHVPQYKTPIKERKPSIFMAYLLHPAVKENILLFIGIFLIMVGEVFVVSNSWSGFSSTMQFVSIYALIFSSTLIFSFIGSFVARRLEVRSGSTILFFITMMLMPLTFVALANLRFPLSAIIIPITLLIYGFMGRNIGRFFHATIPKFVYLYFLPLCLIHLLAPVIKQYHTLWFPLCYGTAAFVIFGILHLIRQSQQHVATGQITTTTILLWGGILGSAWVEFALHMHYALATQKYVLTVAQYAPIIAIMGMVLARIDCVMLKSIEPTSTISLIAISAIVLALTISTGSPYMILLTSIIALAFFMGYTHRFRRYYFFVASLLLSVVVYFLLPFPIKQTIAEWRSQISQGLGYSQDRLPYSFYGITFFPYMIGLCWVGHWMRRWEPKLMRSLQAWFVMLSVGLLVLVKFGGTDVRAPLATLPIYGIGYLLAVMVLEMPFLYYLGIASLSIWVYDVATFMTWPVEQRMLALVSTAILWYSLALRQRFSENMRKVLIDASFSCVVVVLLLGVFFFDSPPAFSYSLAILLASSLLTLAVFVYSARWLWIPSFFMIWISLAFLLYHDRAQSFPTIVLHASTIWSYAAIFIALMIPYLRHKNLIFWLPLRPQIKRLEDKFLIQPLLFLLPLPLIAVNVCALYLWQTPGYDKLYALLAVSFLPPVMSKMFGFSSAFSYLSQLPFSTAILYSLVHSTTIAAWPVLVTSILFVGLALWLDQKIKVIFGLVGISLTVQSLFIYYGTTQYLHEWPLVQAALCTGFFFLGKVCEKMPRLRNASYTVYQFMLVAIYITLAYIGLWRLNFAIRKVDFSPSLIYMYTSLLGAGVLWLTNHKLNRKELPYLVLGFIWLGAIYALDYLEVSSLVYVLCTSIIALLYSLGHLLLPFLRPVALHCSAIFAIASAIPLPYFYKSESSTDHYFILIILLVLMVHALYCFAVTRKIPWVYLSLMYSVIALLPLGLFQIMQVPIFYHPAWLMLLVTIFLGGAWFLKNREHQIVINHIPLHFDGKKLSQVLCNGAGILLSGWLLTATCIWFITHTPYSGQGSHFYQSAQTFVGEYNGIFQSSLFMGLGLAFALSFMQKNHLRNWQETNFVLIGALLLFIHMPLSQIFGRNAHGYFANFDWAAYALLCFLLGLYLRRECYSFWGIVFGIISLIGVSFSYQEFSSVCTVLMIALDLLIISYAHPHWKSTPLYYTILAVGLALLGGYFYHIDKIPSYLLYAPLLGSLLCLGLCFISWKANSWRGAFCQELARYVSWIALVLGLCLGYLTSNPSPVTHLTLLFLSMIIQIPVLGYIGKFEAFRISHYLMLFMVTAFYALLRFRTPSLNFLEGYDHIAFVLLFSILPALGAFFLRRKHFQIVISHFSLICLAISLGSQNSSSYIATYFALAAILMAIRESYITEDEPSNKKGIHFFLGPLFTIISIFFSFHLGITKGMVFHFMLASNFMLIALVGFLYFVRYCEGVYLYLVYISITICGYFLLTLPYLQWGWYPLYLLFCVNGALLTGFSSHNYSWKHFMLPSATVRQVATNFSIVVLGLIMMGSALCCLLLVLNGHRQVISTIVGQDIFIILTTGIIAVLTSLHASRYNKAATTELLWPTAIFLTTGLTAPFGHIISNTAWIVYCPPTIEWALLGVGLCLYGRRANIPTFVNASLVCTVLALLANGYDIQQPITFTTMLFTSIYLLCFCITTTELRQKSLFYHLYTANLLLAVYFFIFYLLFEIGKPVLLVLPVLAMITSILAIAFLFAPRILAMFFAKMKEWLPSFQKDVTQTNIFFSRIAMFFLAGAILLISETTPKVTSVDYSVHIALCICSMILLVIKSLILAQRTNNQYFYYEFQILTVVTFYFVRYRTPWLDFLAGYDPHVLIIFAISFFQIGHAIVNNQRNIANTFFYTSYLLPALTLFYNPWKLEIVGSSLFLLATAHFGLIYLIQQTRATLYITLALLDLALYQLWDTMNIIDPQFYGIPLGLTLIILAELSRNEIHKDRISLLRTIGLLMIYGSSALQVLMQFHHPIYTLYLGALAFLGIVIGLFLKNNLYILISASFLVADVLLYIIKFGMEKGILPGVLLVLAGSAILGTYIYFQRQAIKKVAPPKLEDEDEK